MKCKAGAAEPCVEFLLLLPARKLCVKAAIVEESSQSETQHWSGWNWYDDDMKRSLFPQNTVSAHSVTLPKTMTRCF